MADPQRAHENAPPRPAASSQSAQQRRGMPDETIRPRIGRGTNPIERRGRVRMDAGVVLRSVAVSCTVAVLVLGGFFLMHSLGFGGAREAALRSSSASEPGTKVVTGGLIATTASVSPPPPDDSRRVAALLGQEPPAAAQSPAEAEKAPPPPLPAPRPTPRPDAPSAADFARPAFLEPPGDDEPDKASPAGKRPEATSLTMAKQKTDALAHDEAGSQEGRINMAINLRSGPQRGAAVLATLEAGTKVTIYSCKSWCEVAADGKRGYVYRRAVDQ